jgi:hypothetical protein
MVCFARVTTTHTNFTELSICEFYKKFDTSSHSTACNCVYCQQQRHLFDVIEIPDTLSKIRGVRNYGGGRGGGAHDVRVLDAGWEMEDFRGLPAGDAHCLEGCQEHLTDFFRGSLGLPGGSAVGRLYGFPQLDDLQRDPVRLFSFVCTPGKR